MSKQVDEIINRFRVRLEEAMRELKFEVGRLEKPGLLIDAELLLGGESYPVKIVHSRADREIVHSRADREVVATGINDEVLEVLGPWRVSVEVAGNVDLHNAIGEQLEACFK